MACTRTGADPTIAPVFTDLSAFSSTSISVNLSATFTTASTSFSSSAISKGAFILKESDIETEHEATVNGNTLSAFVTNLKESTTYSYTAYILNSVGNRVISEEQFFTTGDKPTPGDIIPIEDPFLKKWLVARYDKDGDGELSVLEGEGVNDIEVNSENVTSLKGIEYFPSLEHLHAAGSSDNGRATGLITEVDISANPNIRNLYLIRNQLKRLVFPAKNNLTFVEFVGNKIEEIDFSPLKLVERISASENRLSSLDVRGLNCLSELHCDDNVKLTSITLENKELNYLDCHNTAIEYLDLTKCPVLNIVDCSQCSTLKEIYITEKQAIGNLTKDPSAIIVYKND